MKKSNKGLKRVVCAFFYSLAGIKAAFRNEAAFRIEILLFVMLAPVAFYFGKTPIEKIILIASIILVLIAELINSAIESVVDRIGAELHPLSGQAKDMASAAVLLALLLAIITWSIIFIF